MLAAAAFPARGLEARTAENGAPEGKTEAPRAKRYWLWCDGEANFDLLGTREGVAGIVSKAADAGITDLVVDVKLISGEVLYDSRIAPKVLDWNGRKLPGGGAFDRLVAFVDEAHKRGLRVHASVNVFSEAHKQTSPMRGVLLGKKEWQTVIYTPEGALKPTLDINQGPDDYAGFVNPALPEVQAYELSISSEIASRYAVDGLAFDRLRYNNINSDFSDYSRSAFEAWAGVRIKKWPQDIFKHSRAGVKQGKYFKQWLEWRSALIKDFLAREAAQARAINPKLEVSVYAGSWYPFYYDVGVNWASDDFKPGYGWMTPGYQAAGYAKLLDNFMAGCYYPSVTVKELKEKKETYADPLSGKVLPKEDWFSVEGACELAKKAVMGAAPVYGGLYVDDYFGPGGSGGKGFGEALEMCRDRTDGVMVFDLVYIEKRDLWGILKGVFRK